MNLKQIIKEEVARQLNEAADFPRTDFYRRAYETAPRMELKKFDDAALKLAETWVDTDFDLVDVIEILTERMKTVLRNINY